jgi:hypothetical protein
MLRGQEAGMTETQATTIVTVEQVAVAERIAREVAGKDFVHDPSGAGLSLRRLIDYLTAEFKDPAIARLTWAESATAYVEEWERLAGWRGEYPN